MPRFWFFYTLFLKFKMSHFFIFKFKNTPYFEPKKSVLSALSVLSASILRRTISLISPNVRIDAGAAPSAAQRADRLNLPKIVARSGLRLTAIPCWAIVFFHFLAKKMFFLDFFINYSSFLYKNSIFFTLSTTFSIKNRKKS